jgi:uncharacterized protein DUF6223
MLNILGSLVPGLATSVPVGMTPGRAQSLGALAVGLISLILGGLALGRSGGGAGGRPRRATVALVVGVIGMIASVVRLATSTGGIGTGSGRLGAIVALLVALIGTFLGGLALARSRRPLP